jgi:hypothetical protein
LFIQDNYVFLDENDLLLPKLNIFQVDSILTNTPGILTEVAEKACWDPANRGQKLGLVWKLERKSAKFSIMTFAYCSTFYLSFVRDAPLNFSEFGTKFVTGKFRKRV